MESAVEKGNKHKHETRTKKGEEMAVEKGYVKEQEDGRKRRRKWRRWLSRRDVMRNKTIKRRKRRR